MMPHHHKKANALQQTVPSKDMDPLPDNFAPVFFRNQFRTKIELPTKALYPNVVGQRAIITGANAGLGLEAARQLLALGLSHLVMAVRSPARGLAAAKGLQTANRSARTDVWALDMESYESIRAFARKCEDEITGRIDIVILNAGISPLKFTRSTETGHESTVQVNHFGTALLAILLLPVLKAKAAFGISPHLTIVNSVTAHLCKFPNRDMRPLLPAFDDTNILSFDTQERYAVSKLLSQLFIVKLSEYITPGNGSPIINMVDPGLTKGTGLIRDATGIAAVIVKAFFSLAGRPVERGAATYVNAVLGHGPESHGCFLMNCNTSPYVHCTLFHKHFFIS